MDWSICLLVVEMSTYIVAELGINHNGSLKTAKEMILRAKECGCDAVKVQSYRTKDFIPRGHPDWQMFTEAEIWPWLFELNYCAQAVGIEFGTTPSSVKGVREAMDVGVDFLKNGSDYLLRQDVLDAMAKTGLRVFVSTGMASDWHEVMTAAIPFDRGKLFVLHCTSVYPCPAEETSLLRLRNIGRFYRTGFSDHTTGWTAAVAAVALGAEVYERHFTLNHDMEGPDHWFSANPEDMEDVVCAIRETEKMLGSSVIAPTPTELLTRDKWRVKEGSLRG